MRVSHLQIYGLTISYGVPCYFDYVIEMCRTTFLLVETLLTCEYYLLRYKFSWYYLVLVLIFALDVVVVVVLFFLLLLLFLLIVISYYYYYYYLVEELSILLEDERELVKQPRRRTQT